MAAQTPGKVNEGKTVDREAIERLIRRVQQIGTEIDPTRSEKKKEAENKPPVQDSPGSGENKA